MFPIPNGEAKFTPDSGRQRNKGYTGDCQGECDPGHNRKSQAFPDHADQRSEILDLEAHARGKFMACKGGMEEWFAGIAGHDERFAGKVADGKPATGGELRFCRQDGAEFILHQRCGRHSGGRKLHQRHIDHLRLKPFLHWLRALAGFLKEHDLHIGMDSYEAGNDFGEKGYRGTRDGANSYAAGEQAGGVIGLGLNGFEQGQNLTCVGQNAPPGIGWLGSIATPIKESSAQLTLKRGDGMGQRRL